MSQDYIYQEIIDTYLSSKSIKQTADNLGVSVVKVRRVLITEGLWSSATSDAILKLFNAGYSNEEIARKLNIGVKNVRAYIPYTKGSYSDTKKSQGAKRNIVYRDRMEQALNNQQFEDVMLKSLTNANVLTPKRNIYIINTERQVSFDCPIASKMPNKSSDCVYKLHLELVEKIYDKDKKYKTFDLSQDDLIALKEVGNSNGVPSRDILVPGNMTLHALHYAILKLFGWQGGHLHNFSVPGKCFSSITGGIFKGWCKYCGILFKFPDSEEYDQYWDDDYEDNISFNTYLKKKYTGPYNDYSACQTYIKNRDELSKLKKSMKKQGILDSDSWDVADIETMAYFEQDLNFLLERLTISELMTSPKDTNMTAWRLVQNGFIKDNDERVRELKDDNIYNDLLDALGEIKDLRKSLIALENGQYNKNECHYTPEYYHNLYTNRLTEALKTAFPAVNFANPTVEPFTDTLYYSYDYGDDWHVKISCEKILKSESPDYIPEIIEQGKPICTAANGLKLIDDVGGFYGYINFLKTISDNNNEDADDMLSWASSMGWNGRNVSPKHML